MKEQIELRVNELKAELEAGQKVMEEMEIQRSNITYTLLRITGAIQVLEELVQKEEADSN
ncbi:MAG: hypothetical protein K0R50_1525 [Eubacterium sp.]|jgi:hypothetical protein|nr:hypothetical protein [Eubacterium sp.]